MKSLVDDPSLWHGDELARRPGWERDLTTAEVTEIEAALEHVKSAGTELEAITREDFPLPTLGKTLEQAGRELEHGVGSVLLHGWPVQRHDIEDNRRVFWGLSRHLGTPVSQSAEGEQIFHVEDSGFKVGHPKARGPNTRKKLNFHCDRCDVIGFMCVRQAKEGGENLLVSSAAIHNEILRTRPDLLDRLYEPWYYKTHNVDTSNSDPWCRQPIFAVEQGHFVAYILRVLIDRAYELPELPDMTAEQKEALDLIDSLCADPRFHHRFRQAPGDLLFVNNFVNFHSRTEFTDHEEADQKRLLLRIWLSMPDSRPLPASFAGAFGQTAAGSIRGGIHPPSS